MSLSDLIDRSALRRAYREEEDTCARSRLEQAQLSLSSQKTASDLACKIIAQARSAKPKGIDAFLLQYGLDTDEGIALMCLAEALLRVPDTATSDRLIRDKVGKIEWRDHLGESSSTFVNAATFSLMLTGEIIDTSNPNQKSMRGVLKQTIQRLGEPVIRKAAIQAMKVLGSQFVFGRNIEEAIARSEPQLAEGLTHSFDMLGEAAMTYKDAETYADVYEDAIQTLAGKDKKKNKTTSGVSVKLSALHPKYNFLNAEVVQSELIPILRRLVLMARDADIHFTIDAEETDRLELSMDIIEALASDDSLFERADGSRWNGFGFAIQAYQKRAISLCDWAAELARSHGRLFFIRLVKGAYWDSEIKLSQMGGYSDYPVFTRKVTTDVSYQACAKRLFQHSDVIFPAFATHNAYTIGAVKALSDGRPFEFQRLHGMGEEIYDALGKVEGENRTPVRIYAPVGGHKQLLAYLVRRLLENGANTSFVNRVANQMVPVKELVADPVVELENLDPKRNPLIPLPRDIFRDRLNSSGIDLSDPMERKNLEKNLAELESHLWSASPTFPKNKKAKKVAIFEPFNPKIKVGVCQFASKAEVRDAIKRASEAQFEWDALGGIKRGEILENAAALFEKHTVEFVSLCQREGGKTVIDALLEVREAVDFLRYYAAQGRQKFEAAFHLPGPTGEENTLRMHGRGTFAVISPWNFPLAIFIGPTAAALAAGNSVVTKPAEQTPLIAALAVSLCHEAGVPENVLQILPGSGDVGQMITSDPQICGVAFTGSTETAKVINRTLANRDAPVGTFIAETGGQNAMIVDSSALPEQVVRDVLASAFQSAGQRCSAQRMLYIQEDVYDVMLDMIRGAIEALNIGSPKNLSTDVGPVIDKKAQHSLEQHIRNQKRKGLKIWYHPKVDDERLGYFVCPTIIEINSISELKREHFGPVLHVAKFAAKDLGKIVQDINATGYGLTLGLHSRITAIKEFVERHAKVGNFYVNRNQIGAVVESQPFGGEGLSGTGPKAGGPNYIARFATERVSCVDTTAAGGNASLLSA